MCHTKTGADANQQTSTVEVAGQQAKMTKLSLKSWHSCHRMKHVTCMLPCRGEEVNDMHLDNVPHAVCLHLLALVLPQL
jgi:hypothetical protein